jgi:hypothetical protein
VRERSAETPQPEDQERSGKDLEPSLERFRWDVHSRRQFADAYVQREHERGRMQLGGEWIVNQPPRLLCPLPHGRLVLREVVDEPHRAEARGALRRATRRQDERQLPDQERDGERAKQPSVPH